MTLWLITGVNIHGSSNVKYLGILGIIDHLWHGGRPTTGVYRILQSGGLVDLHPCRQRPPVPFLIMHTQAFFIRHCGWTFGLVFMDGFFVRHPCIRLCMSIILSPVKKFLF